jgi:hypothetical protein
MLIALLLQAVVLQAFERGTDIVRARPAVTLRVVTDVEIPTERVLVVEYPPPSDDPASRDIWIDTEQRDWSKGRAIEFEARSEHPTRLSISFLDGNRVAYMSGTDLPGTGWHTVRVVFDSIRPNPYFQPPDAKQGAKLDVRDVGGVGVSPQDRSAGRLWIRKLLLVR